MHRRTAVALTLGIFAVTIAGPSGAADLGRPLPQEAPIYQPLLPLPFTWQGFYVGINGGYGWGNSTLTTGAASSTVHPEGGLLGTTFGYNMQFGGVVAGIESDVDYGWMEATKGGGAPCPGCTVRNHYLATLRGRIGWAWDRWLPYITGGLAFGDIQTSTPVAGAQATDKVGWTIGGGLEYAFAGPWSAKIEYLYADLGSATCDAAHCGVPVDTSLNVNTVRFGINYRF